MHSLQSSEFVDRHEEEEEYAFRSISTYTSSGVLYVLLDTELLDYLPKKASMFGSVQAFPMYGGLGMSTPSLHRVFRDFYTCFTHFFQP